MKQSENQDPLYIAAVERAMTVLRVLGQAGDPLGTSEIARSAGLTQSTTWRICYTLQKLGFITSDAHGRFRPGLPLLALGHAALEVDNMQEVATPFLEDLVSRFNGGASLAIRDNDAMLLIARVQSRASVLTMNLQTGSRVPIFNTAVGWALLAAMPAEDRNALLVDQQKRHGKMPPKVQKQMEEQLRAYPRQGYVLNIEVYHPDVGFAAAPFVHPRTGETVTLNCGGVLSSLSRETLTKEVGPALRETAAMLRSALGHQAR